MRTQRTNELLLGEYLSFRSSAVAAAAHHSHLLSCSFPGLMHGKSPGVAEWHLCTMAISDDLEAPFFKAELKGCAIPKQQSLRRPASIDRSSFETSEIFEEWDLQDAEIDNSLANYRGLVLDVTYRPINVVCWRRALCLEFLEKADVLEYHDYVISSPSRAFAIPAVLRVTDYIHTPKRGKVKLLLNRKNLFLRDKYRCQYCDAREKLTVDHVVPISRGGEWTWQNLVTACSKCNTRKGDKTLEEANMQLVKAPKEPKALDTRELSAVAFRVFRSSKSFPTKWMDYLPKQFKLPDAP